MNTHRKADNHALAGCLRLLATTGVMMLAACKPPAEGTDSHAGHGHGAEETDSHAGHGHGEEGGESVHVKGGICQEHMVPEDACGICNPDKIAGLKPGESLQLRLASGKSADVAGVQTAKPEESLLAEGVECYAEFGFNLNKFARIAAPVSGVIHDVTVDLGSKVSAQQSVAKIWSAQIAEAVAKAALSHQTLERERKLRAQQVTPEKDLQEAEAAHRAVCHGLRTFGFTEAQIDELSDKPQEAVMLDAGAPFAGEITGRTAVRGALVEVGAPLFTIADRSLMWADLAVPETALPRLKEGQQVEIAVDALPDRMFTGKLTWISAELDETTRMVRARAEVPNPDGLLKARMFAKARILTGSGAAALVVPAAAIQRVDGKPFVFVKLGVDLFDARAVLLGSRAGDGWVVAEGLKAGEEVAVAHGFALKSQLLISRLGAGCADD
jgi:cobalt-zinc-cadmium efflux system membrane fusion protein